MARRVNFDQSSLFFKACSTGDVSEARTLLYHGLNINTSRDGCTALHEACIKNNFRVIQFLVRNGCHLNEGDKNGWTPLHFASYHGLLHIARYLIENGADVASVNSDEDLPIDVAKTAEMFDYLSNVLLQKGVNCDEARSIEEKLMSEDVNDMLNTNNFREKTNPLTGASALHVAASKGYISVLKSLIQLGADLNVKDNDGWTPLHAAAHWNQRAACAVLTDNLADMNIQNFHGETCFDVSGPRMIRFLKNLKIKQGLLTKDTPESQAILHDDYFNQQPKSAAAIACMSNKKKKSILKNSFRAQIENRSLPVEKTEDVKDICHFSPQEFKEVAKKKTCTPVIVYLTKKTDVIENKDSSNEDPGNKEKN